MFRERTTDAEEGDAHRHDSTVDLLRNLLRAHLPEKTQLENFDLPRGPALGDEAQNLFESILCFQALGRRRARGEEGSSKCFRPLLLLAALMPEEVVCRAFQP